MKFIDQNLAITKKQYSVIVKQLQKRCCSLSWFDCFWNILLCKKLFPYSFNVCKNLSFFSEPLYYIQVDRKYLQVFVLPLITHIINPLGYSKSVGKAILQIFLYFCKKWTLFDTFWDKLCKKNILHALKENMFLTFFQSAYKCSFVDETYSSYLNIYKKRLRVHAKLIIVQVHNMPKSIWIACTKVAPIFLNAINKPPSEWQNGILTKFLILNFHFLLRYSFFFAFWWLMMSKRKFCRLRN